MTPETKESLRRELWEVIRNWEKLHNEQDMSFDAYMINQMRVSDKINSIFDKIVSEAGKDAIEAAIDSQRTTIL